MSISVPLAVTMMMGTGERARMARHTSIPDILGSMMSSSTRSGSMASKSCQRLGPVPGHVHVEALTPEPDDQGVDEGLLVLGHEHRHRPGAVPASRSGAPRRSAQRVASRGARARRGGLESALRRRCCSRLGPFGPRCCP